MQLLIKFRVFITEKFFMISLFIFLSTTMSANNVFKGIFRLLSGWYPYKSAMAELLKADIINSSPWIEAVCDASKKLGFRKRISYINSFVNIFYRSKVRRRYVESTQNVTIPVVMILSLTARCNLNCPGCYAKRFKKQISPLGDLFNLEKAVGIIEKARDSGIGSFILVGGEPLLFEGLLELPLRFKDCAFFIFTNTTLIDEAFIKKIKKMSNVFPVLSLEANDLLLKKNRCIENHEKIRIAEEALIKNRILYGKSFIINAMNYKMFLESNFRNTLFTDTCRAMVLIKYTGNDSGLILSEKDTSDFNRYLVFGRRKDNGIVINFPEDEFSYFGKCGKGEKLIHVAPDGTVEPCPFDCTKLGNVLEDDFKSILRGARERMELGAKCSGNFEVSEKAN